MSVAGLKDVVLLGKETTRGTAAATMPLHQPIRDAGLQPTIENHTGEIVSSTGWPYADEEVPLGTTAALDLDPKVNVATIRDLILMAKRDAGGLLPSLTVAHKQSGVGDAHYLGCVCSSLELTTQRSLDASAILAAKLGFACMKPDATTGLAAGTQGTGNMFQMRFSTFELNSVAAQKVKSCRIAVTHELEEGEPDGDNKRIYLAEGLASFEVVLVAVFATQDWLNLVRNGTICDGEVLFGTGTANETVTATLNKVKPQRRTLSDTGTVVTEEITIKPFFDGTHNPIVWTWGTAIGASVLGLS